MNPDGIHHLTIRVTDLEAARHFYEDVLGLELDQVLEGKYRFRLGGGADAPRLVVRSLLPGGDAADRFDERRVGLDHVALTSPDRADLERLVATLTAAGVPTRGIQDVPGGGELVSFRDPDNIQWELFWG